MLSIWTSSKHLSFGKELKCETVLDWSKLKEFVGSNFNMTQELIFILESQKILFEKMKCWLEAFSPFHTIFGKIFFLWVIISQDCVVKG